MIWKSIFNNTQYTCQKNFLCVRKFLYTQIIYKVYKNNDRAYDCTPSESCHKKFRGFFLLCLTVPSIKCMCTGGHGIRKYTYLLFTYLRELVFISLFLLCLFKCLNEDKIYCFYSRTKSMQLQHKSRNQRYSRKSCYYIYIHA